MITKHAVKPYIINLQKKNRFIRIVNAPVIWLAHYRVFRTCCPRKTAAKIAWLFVAEYAK